jgi:hypothetical protein
MILKKITPENIKSLNWFDTIYVLDKPINNRNKNPKISQIMSFSEGESKYNLLDGHLYCLKSILLD